jgi:hypothetical protein
LFSTGQPDSAISDSSDESNYQLSLNARSFTIILARTQQETLCRFAILRCSSRDSLTAGASIGQIDAADDQRSADGKGHGNWLVENQESGQNRKYGNKIDEQTGFGRTKTFHTLVIPDKSDDRSKNAQVRNT